MREEICTALGGIIEVLFEQKVPIELSRPDAQFGDYATNIALLLASSQKRSPRSIAEQLAPVIKERLSSMVADVTVAGPGFINIALTSACLLEQASRQPSQSYAGQTIVVEYSDPNPFKPLHAGHLYTTLVGDTIARLIENAGAKTIRVNFGGDVGLHVAKSMWAILKEIGGEQPAKLADISENQRAAWLGDRYVTGNAAYEEDEAAKAQILNLNQRIYALHAEADHSSPFAQIYWTCRQWSYDYLHKLYQNLAVVPFARYIPESEVTEVGLMTVKEQLARGVFKTSDGAVVFPGEQYGVHTRVFINSAGLPTYETKDVGLSLTKWRDYHYDRSIIITANEQAQYMQVVLAAIAQFAPEAAKRTEHITHGVVKLAGGVKMSSRRGNTLLATDILAAAEEAGRQSESKPSPETVLAAVKYSFVKSRIGGDIIYLPQESIALEGNSGPYLQYAHARARSILAKANLLPSQLENLEADERRLLRALSQYPEVVERATDELMPHHICSYLYELAQEFNRFYEKNRVLGDGRETLRLGLIELYADTLKRGLELLGLTAPNKM